MPDVVVATMVVVSSGVTSVAIIVVMESGVLVAASFVTVVSVVTPVSVELEVITCVVITAATVVSPVDDSNETGISGSVVVDSLVVDAFVATS